MSDIAPIFRGCDKPELIDEYLDGLKAGTRVKTLIDMRKEVEQLKYDSEMQDSNLAKCYNEAIKEVLQLIKEMITESIQRKQ